jgi:hypothetical protein
MDFKDLPNVAFVFLLVGVFFALGIVILSSFQTNVVSSNTITNESFTMPSVNGTIVLGHYKVTTISGVANSTGSVYPAANYSITTYDNSTVQFLENASVCKTGATCRVSYVYNTYDTAVPMTIQKTITAMSEIPNNWLLLIAVVLAATVIIGVVVANLGKSAMERN